MLSIWCGAAVVVIGGGVLDSVVGCVVGGGSAGFVVAIGGVAVVGGIAI